jgi:hypothetical protein
MVRKDCDATDVVATAKADAVVLVSWTMRVDVFEGAGAVTNVQGA